MLGHGYIIAIDYGQFRFRHVFPDGSNDYLVVVHSCSGVQWQDWQRKGDTIFNAGQGKCLTIVGSTAKGRDCDGSDTQRWDMP